MRIDPAKHPWLEQPETRAVMEALGEARIVGGAVRNALLGAGVNDIDIAVPMPPDESLKRLQAARIKVVPTGFDHGTVTAIKNDKVFEITSLRRDVSTDGRHAVVAYTTDWREDAGRRDFTINALYCAGDGEVFDYHDGIADLIAGQVRFVGDARQRIAEDYLRILRLFRFHAWYGRGEMDADALRASGEAKAGLKQLSGERIAKEMLRLLESINPWPVLRVMAACGVLPEILPFPLQWSRLEQMIHLDAENFFTIDPLLRLAALLPNDPSAAQAVAGRMRLSNADRDRLTGLADGGGKLLSHLPPRDIHRLLYEMGVPAFHDRVRLGWADAPPGANAIAWRMLLSVAGNFRRPAFPLSGRDVMAAGVPEGPSVGKILAAVEDWWIDNGFPTDDAALTEQLQQAMRSAE
jgi:poly(A) polymerase